MPIFMDRHDLRGLSAADVADAHSKDLEVQDQYGVKFLTYWFDQARGSGFCLIEAPDKATAMRVHGDSHGEIATDIIEVELSAVEAFLGRITDPRAQAPGAAPEIDSAFRAVMFTDIVNSTDMTARLGDIRSVEMVRAHDSMVRRALTRAHGREIKHTGDGLMASCDDVVAAVECACAIQRAFEEFNRDSTEKLQVRIGVHSGEPVQDGNDIFGATVQMSARICAHAAPGAILISDAVRRELPDSFSLNALGPCHLKGFADPIALYDVCWSKEKSP
jgi:class 3 adenylate cyclase